jgi:FkbH-like protein
LALLLPTGILKNALRRSTMDFNQLLKSARSVDSNGFRKVKLAILGDYSTQFLHKALRAQGLIRKADLEIYEADYDQINSEIINTASGLYKFQPQYVLITRSVLKLQENFYSTADKENFFLHEISRIRELINTIAENGLAARIIFTTNELTDDAVFGNYYAKTAVSFYHQMCRLNNAMLDLAGDSENVFLCDINKLILRKGFAYARDWSLVINSDLLYALDFHVDLSEEIIRLILCFEGVFHKCLILDLDNTLWGGIIGDDGIDQIQIGAFGIGKAFSRLQKWAKQLKNRGVILAVCSKNTEEIAKAPFLHHPEMELKMEDISVFVANWDNKADNIRYIQSVLNIGFDAMVFVDDNPAERELIRRELPGVTVPEMPADPALYLDYLTGMNLFETTSFSETDLKRTLQYQAESQRKAFQQTFRNMDEYLASLEMKGSVKPFEANDFPRIAQLSQRSNQFNLRTIRYTPDEISHMASDPAFLTYAVNLGDKFGDYGLISIVIVRLIDGDQAFIDTWIMSCRVLKRDVEKYVLNKMVADLQSRNIPFLQGEYRPTEKNALVKNHYADLGFSEKDGFWNLNTKNYLPFNHSIG